MTNEWLFKDWLLSENYRIAQEYKKLMYNELVECRKSFGYDLGLAMPVFLSTIKNDIELPPYNKYEGSLPKEQQQVIYNSLPKLNKDKIRIEFIKENLNKGTVTLADKNAVHRS
jgi:hypothetical protein